MQANQYPFINGRHLTRLLVVCFILTAIFILVSFAVRGRGSQGAKEIKLSVKDPRPVAEAIQKLEAKYGWAITYEDPRYVHDSEMADVTLKVRKNLDDLKPGIPPKVLVPKGGILEFTYEVASDTNIPADPARVVQKLLDAQAASGNPGRFRLESSGKTMHVIPTSIKNSEGVLVQQESALDSEISLPAEERTVLQKLENICTAISRATNIPVKLGAIPEYWLNQEKDRQGAVTQKARDVLVNTFAMMEYGKNLSWQLFYSPTMKTYFLHLHYVQGAQ